MYQPEGYTNGNSNMVCKLNKALYGLKQAPMAWFLTLQETLFKLGFHNLKSDTSLFIRHTTTSVIYLLCYVDDIVVAGNNSTEINLLIAELNGIFPLKDLGNLHYFLGLEILHLQDGRLHVSQQKYAKELVERAGMLDANPMPTPMISSLKLYQGDSKPCEDPRQYRSIVGALQYLTTTRPDLAYSVNKVSQFMHNSTLNQWKAVKRILRYVKGTVREGLVFTKNTNYRIFGFAYADWGADFDDRKSITGYCIYLGNNLVVWKCQKQSKLSRSTTEAEYRAVASAQTEIMTI
ncbi:hypothetical protein PIB30_118207 [Stylosanthes scabra]|uniref:Reverse transcriptase Ty1/copia-type domain-containing protein n=1 Tax=Stylosanthes scabra TaxID=79078 RepID=A0ABU6UJP4_9FABA|nr:hypothetical protein [Stylosanthes scabra]